MIRDSVRGVAEHRVTQRPMVAVSPDDDEVGVVLLRETKKLRRRVPTHQLGGMDRKDLRVERLRQVGRPAQRLLRAIRTVDADSYALNCHQPTISRGSGATALQSPRS